LALAKLGHQVSGSDLSAEAVTRARKEALKRSLDIDFRVADMTSLGSDTDRKFDSVIAFDNALPHLSPDQLERAAPAIRSVLKSGGLLMASIRDYDQIVLDKPTIQQPVFFTSDGRRRIVHQVWDWVDDVTYVVHLYVTRQLEKGWESLHFVSEYRCLLREHLTAILRGAGFQNVEWIMPTESGFYQPIVLARS
jgi:glycine/sarcosine N-methyltransferase